MSVNLEDLDGKFWKTLKKKAGIKSSGWFKKADASVGKHIDALNEARKKFRFSDLTEDLLKYQEALDKLASTFSKFMDVKGLKEIEEDDIKKAEKEALVEEIQEWDRQIQQAKKDLQGKIEKLMKATGGDVKKIDKLDKGKKREVWDKTGISDTFNL